MLERQVGKTNNKDNYGKVEPLLPQPAESAGHQYEVIFEDKEYISLTTIQKNQLVESIKLYMVHKNKVEKHTIWTTLQRGSLKVCGDLQDFPATVTWPTKSELRAFIRDVERPDEPPGIPNTDQHSKTMAERVQDTLGPFSEFDPWMANRQEGAEGQRGDTAEGNEDSKGGLKLVTEKNIDMMKFHGDQDPQNQIHFNK